MKKTVSFLLALVLLLSIMPLGSAAQASPPYSLPYLSGIQGVSYVIYTDLENKDKGDATLINRTLEVYDATVLAESVDYDWEKITERFSKVFKDLDFVESYAFVDDKELFSFVQDGKLLLSRYVYRRGNEIFTILDEDESENILERKGLVFILHETYDGQEEIPADEKADSYSGELFANIGGALLVRVFNYPDVVSGLQNVTERTIDAYDIKDLSGAVNGSWEKITAPFRTALTAAGYKESGPTETGAYIYVKGNEYFSILGEIESINLIKDVSYRLYVKHERHTALEGLPDIDYSKPLTAQEASDYLHALGLFSGVGTNEDGTPNYDLQRAPTRFEGIAMLVRLLGKEEEAFAAQKQTPFTDVVSWAQPYVGYAYENGLAYGVSDTQFGGAAQIGAAQYLTFVLRALGYKDGVDFQWDRAWELSDKIGLTHGDYADPDRPFLRGDVAAISFNALYQNLKGNDTRLIDTLDLKIGA